MSSILQMFEVIKTLTSFASTCTTSLSTSSPPCTITTKILDSHVFQRGISEHEINSTPAQILRGSMILFVYEPVLISNIKVRFFGKQIILTGDDPEKRILADDVFTWNYSQPHESTPIGVYTYPFQFIIQSDLPESIISPYVKVNYSINASVNYIDPTSKSFNTLQLKAVERKINLLRCVIEHSSTNTESIAITGNWRNILIYDFNFQNKVVFQGNSYIATIKIYPSTLLLKFKVYSISIWLNQIICTNGINPNEKQFEETNKILLRRKLLSLHDKDINMNQYMSTIVVPIPKQDRIQTDINKEPRSIYPRIGYTNSTNIHKSVRIHHNIKICLEVSEIQENTSTSFPSNNDIQLDSKSNLRNSPPNNIAYHPCLSDRNRYKKVELAFHAPICILDELSSTGLATPPLYSHKSIPNKPDEELSWGVPPPYDVNLQ
ncbi:hypothetical protein CAAN1_12S01090 [[Candida] anglica]|uniref:Arrestin-like N-terminal domain-containing protein n=1 Tax=[Candida] anglica TaxID=148631 RepID=A0ABP0E7N3_9ASCO